MAGILGNFGGPEGGILGGFGRFGTGIQNNSDALAMMGLQLMSAKPHEIGSALAQGYGAGSRTDALRMAQRRKEEEEAKKRQTLSALLQQNQLDPRLADQPDLAEKMLAQRMTPKEARQPSFEERMITSGGPEAVEAYRRKLLGLNSGDDEVAKAGQRERIADTHGLPKDSPQRQSFVLTGKLPRDDQKELTASDRRVIDEADEQVLAAQGVIGALERAKALSPKAMEGIGASTLGRVTSQFGHERGLNTVELDNEVETNALNSMKTVFGNNPTEGERAALKEVQGSSSQPHSVRVKIYERAQALVQKRLDANKQRADQMRGNTYYKQGGGSAFHGGANTHEVGATITHPSGATIQRIR